MHSAPWWQKTLAWAVAGLVTLVCLYPYYWMLVSAFRTSQAILASPLRPWPETLSLDVLREIASVGGTPLWRYALNSLLITSASTVLGVLVTALGAYALVRRPSFWVFRLLRAGFMVTIMYPYMLLVIPVYIVMFKMGLLGSYTGIILFLALGPIQFFLFEQFFQTIPKSVMEAAVIDGATEAQILFSIVLPMAMPVVATATIITFLLNWAQWLPVMVVSRSPDTYTLPVALMNLNGELGVNFQGIMAMSVLITIPVTLFFLIAQRRVMSGMTAGAVKG
ncbi:carbohydrate ABC transporter permease [Rhodoferax sp.]|jgi:ABC-type glycerol-3-phosphate transport system permease component|uniref:carbohydrate ABC transporter permease n=1 Tax=Rhodoferax sp. TaxID=50421 RepID=UPI003785014E